MKPVDIYRLNPQHEEVVSVRSDIRVRALPENVCCMRIRELREITISGLGLHHSRVNYCWICGKKLR